MAALAAPRRDGARFDRVLACRLGTRRVGVPAAETLGVQPAKRLTPLPHGPAAASMTTVFRQEAVPVVDLRLTLGMPPRAPDERSFLAVVQAGARRLALQVDAVDEVLDRAAAPDVETLDPTRALEPDDAWRLEQALRAVGLTTSVAQAAGGDLELVSFTLSGERFALDAGLSRGAFRMEDLRPIPHAPPHIVGCTLLEGDAVPVVELRRVFGIASTGLHDNGWLLALGKRRAEFGIMTDGVEPPLRLRAGALKPCGQVRPELRGLARGWTPDGALALHGDALLHDPRLVLA
jgi:purine-binding chemotaxis protein CheW